MEYMLIHGGSRGHHLQYELLYDGATDTTSHLCGLIDPSELAHLRDPANSQCPPFPQQPAPQHNPLLRRRRT